MTLNRYYFFLLFIFLGSVNFSFAQQKIKGYVYEDEYRTPMPDVFVYSTSGEKSISDSMGYFSIPVRSSKDSIFFSYKTRTTHKFSVDTIADPDNFEIAIHLNVLTRKNPPPGYLPDVTVYSSNYRMDSIRNREEYAEIFNFKKPGIEDIASVPKIGNIPIPVGVYFDVNAIAEGLQFRKNKRRENYRDFALWLEQEKYIDYRFNKRLIGNITNLKEDKLDNFLKTYRPEFLTLVAMSDVELGVYIKKCLKNFNEKNTPNTFIEKLRSGGIILDEKGS